MGRYVVTSVRGLAYYVYTSDRKVGGAECGTDSTLCLFVEDLQASSVLRSQVKRP
jgi:hypothetical protein